jgi:CHASE2 domain-containing sensor protein
LGFAPGYAPGIDQRTRLVGFIAIAIALAVAAGVVLFATGSKLWLVPFIGSLLCFGYVRLLRDIRFLRNNRNRVD